MSAIGRRKEVEIAWRPPPKEKKKLVKPRGRGSRGARKGKRITEYYEVRARTIDDRPHVNEVRRPMQEPRKHEGRIEACGHPWGEVPEGTGRAFFINRNGFNTSDGGLEMASDLAFLDDGNVKMVGFAEPMADSGAILRRK